MPIRKISLGLLFFAVSAASGSYLSIGATDAPSEGLSAKNESVSENQSASVTLNSHLKTSRPSQTLCEKSWEEAPGTADYTTQSSYFRSRNWSVVVPVDRPESSTLLGSSQFANLAPCERAKLLKPCFEKVTLKGEDWGARGFRNWAKRERVNPVRAHLAIAFQETRLGALRDSCRKGVCNGYGLLQVLTAWDAQGNNLNRNSPQWLGIKYNIMTNITHSARVLAQKAKLNPRSLGEIAFYYNGNPRLRDAYAEEVERHYQSLKSCSI
jgi:hypothetical protein